MTRARSLKESVWNALVASDQDVSTDGWMTLNQLLSLVNFPDQDVSDQHIGLSSIKLVDPVESIIHNLRSEGKIEFKENAPIYETDFRITRSIVANSIQNNLSFGNESYGQGAGGAIDTPTIINSTSWKGLTQRTIIDARNAKVVSQLIEQALTAIPDSAAGNFEHMQAVAYLKAAKELVDAPEPPSELIWQLISKAADLVGLVGLFYTIFAQAAS
jgi:hypothetical protein